jgi:hypothetical protein
MSYPTGYAQRSVTEYNAAALTRSLLLPTAAFKSGPRSHVQPHNQQSVHMPIAENSTTASTVHVSGGIAAAALADPSTARRDCRHSREHGLVTYLRAHPQRGAGP